MYYDSVIIVLQNFFVLIYKIKSFINTVSQNHSFWLIYYN